MPFVNQTNFRNQLFLFFKCFILSAKFENLREMPPITAHAAYADLQKHYDEMKDVHMRTLFDSDPNRFVKFKVTFEDLLLDYSKCA